MSKFYVTSGILSFVTTAEDSHSVALWAINQFMSGRIDLDSMDWTSPETIDRPDVMQALLSLDEEIKVSEIGFGHDDVDSLDTHEILNEWCQLLVAIRRLESLIQ